LWRMIASWLVLSGTCYVVGEENNFMNRKAPCISSTVMMLIGLWAAAQGLRSLLRQQAAGHRTWLTGGELALDPGAAAIH
jgi:hypothetical protein